MVPWLILSSLTLLTGIALGGVGVLIAMEWAVREKGHATWRWGKRWYRVQGRNRP